MKRVEWPRRLITSEQEQRAAEARSVEKRDKRIAAFEREIATTDPTEEVGGDDGR